MVEPGLDHRSLNREALYAKRNAFPRARHAGVDTYARRTNGRRETAVSQTSGTHPGGMALRRIPFLLGSWFCDGLSGTLIAKHESRYRTDGFLICAGQGDLASRQDIAVPVQ
jgi:hypothetical protein